MYFVFQKQVAHRYRKAGTHSHHLAFVVYLKGGGNNFQLGSQWAHIDTKVIKYPRTLLPKHLNMAVHKLDYIDFVPKLAILSYIFQGVLGLIPKIRLWYILVSLKYCYDTLYFPYRVSWFVELQQIEIYAGIDVVRPPVVVVVFRTKDHIPMSVNYR